MTFGGRWPAMEDDLKRKMTFAGSFYAAYSALRYFFFNWCSTFLYNKYWLFSKTLKNENKPKNDENPKNEGDLQKKGTPKMKTTTQLKTNPKMRGCVRHGSQYTDHNSFITSPLMLIHFAAHSFLRFFTFFSSIQKYFLFVSLLKFEHYWMGWNLVCHELFHLFSLADKSYHRIHSLHLKECSSIMSAHFGGGGVWSIMLTLLMLWKGVG